MIKKTLTATIGALSLAVAAGAQSPQTTPQSSQPTTSSSSSSQAGSSTMKEGTTITGCLKAGSEAGTYELQQAKKDSASSSATSSSSSSASAAAGAAKDDKVTVKAGSGVDLAAHVGHTVELTGSWSSASAGAAGDTTSSSASKAGKTFTATNVKMVSATCTTGTN